MSDVFISYKAEDRRRVQPLVQALQADGLSVWWDEHIGAGDAWRETIERQLDEAKCVVVIWSKRSVAPEGRFVREEASRAQRRGAYVPVLIDAIEPPLGFGESQATSLRGWHGAPSDPHYQAVLAAVRKNVGGRRRTSAKPLPQPKMDRRTVIAGGSAAAVAVAGVGAWALLKPSSASASDSIAVLPFENLSGDPAQAYFSDGIAEEIRSALARIAGLKVVGRTSSEAVRNEDAQSAAKKLAVANILTGSVRQSPSTIPVTAELIDGRSGIDRWSQDYDRAPGDAIKIQTDIAENVASALSAALGTVARKAIEVGGTNNPEAQALVLEMSALVKGKGGKAALDRALALLNRAIAIDPNYADAYARKSLVVVRLSDAYSEQSFAAGHAEALQLANTAIRIAPALERGYRARSGVYQASLLLAPAFADQKRAFQLAPANSNVLRDYSGFLSTIGRFSEALPMADKAVAADPLDPTAYANRVNVLIRARRISDAIAESERVKRDTPQLFSWYILLGAAYLMAGRLAEARATLDQAEQDHPERLTLEAIVAGRQHDDAAMLGYLSRLKRLFGDNAAYQYAQLNAQLGRKEEAFAALQMAWRIKDPGLAELKTDPLFDPVRSDPRFADMLRKVNFPA